MMVDIVDPPAGFSYTGPSFSDLSEAAQSAGLSVPNNPPTSLSYLQSKAAEFQSVLNALDSGYYAAQIALNSPELLAADESLYDDLQSMLSEFESKKNVLRITAEAINGGASIFNALGGDLQRLNIPSTLGIAPALPVIIAGAFAVVATLTPWGIVWLRGLNQRLARAQLLDSMSPEAAASAAQAALASDNALQEAEGTSFSAMSNYIKWGAIALAAFLAYKAAKDAGLLKGLK